MDFIGFAFPKRKHSEPKKRRTEWKTRKQLHTRATANLIIKVYTDTIKVYLQTINKILYQSQVTIKAVKNQMAGRNKFQHIQINISILQRRRWGVWRVEVSSNYILFFPKHFTHVLYSALQNTEQSQLSEKYRTPGFQHLAEQKYTIVLHLWTQTLAFQINEPTLQISESCTTCRL